MTAPDPFDALRRPVEPQDPRPSFVRALRGRLLRELEIDDDPPIIRLPDRRSSMSTTSAPSTATQAPIATAVTPYLTARDAVAALAWYAEAFGAVEQFRVVGDDGRLGHAEFTIGEARFMLSDEHEELGVVAPTTLGGTPFALHLTVSDVDAMYARAVAAGATAQVEPADQPHGNRHGTLLDPFGHRWMLSQPLEAFDLDTYTERSRGSGWEVQRPDREGGIWAVVTYDDAEAGIRFLTETLGFEEWVMVRDEADPSHIVHSEYRWPDGGVVQLADYVEGNEFLRPPGEQGLYVVTRDPWAVWERCKDAPGVEVLREPYSPHYDADGMGFSIRDPEGNTWSFGTYAGGATA